MEQNSPNLPKNDRFLQCFSSKGGVGVGYRTQTFSDILHVTEFALLIFQCSYKFQIDILKCGICKIKVRFQRGE